MSHEHDQGDGHGDHDHPPFLAHHFDDPEQQYDSGKLGMWLFLVTEILFFSGMFCAYALYRAKHPEVWTFASQFLNETLGAINTGVLLFSSLTMAWGVRCAQLRQQKGLVISLAMTLGCAAIFLGVKAVEYTHKWELGLLPAGTYISQYSVGEHHEGLSPWLYYLSVIPAICVIGFALWYAKALASGVKQKQEVYGPLLATALCYFVGVGLGIFIESATAEKHESGHTEAHGAVEPGHADNHEGDDHGDGSHDEHGSDEHGEGHENDTASAAESATTLVSLTTPDADITAPGQVPIEQIDQAGGAGLFFSIYYCMTGVHAIHIIGGMIVLTWLLVRASKDHFNEQYFGPVDYVGLYWHIVDLIWIYLFPLLYLIT